MHDERFDDELKNRLGGYTEEPDDALWQGIAAGITSTPTGMGWLGWVSRTLLASVVVVSVLHDSSFQGSGLKVNESMVEEGEDVMAFENSKFKIQNSKLGADGLDVYERSSNEGDSQVPVDEDLMACEDDRSNGVGGTVVAQSSRLSARSAKLKVQGSGLNAIAAGDRGVNDVKDRVLRPEVKGGGPETKVSDTATENAGRVKDSVQRSEAVSSAAKHDGNTGPGMDDLKVKENDRLVDERSKQRSGMAGADSKATFQDAGIHQDSKAVVISSNGHVVSKDLPVAADTVELGKEAMVQPGSEAKSVALRVESTAENNEDVGVVNYAGPARPSKGRGAVAEKPLRMIDSAQQVVKVKEEKVKEPREEKPGEDKPGREPGPLSIYFTAMPTLGYQKLEANPSDNVIVESFEKLSNFSSKRLGVRAEIGVEYTLTPRVKAFGGLLYYQRKQTISYTERVSTGFKEYVSGDTLTLDPQFALEDRSFEYELKNLGVQLGLNYILWKKKFLHVAGTGIEFHKALNKLPEAQKELGFTSYPSTYVFYNLYYRVQYPAEGRLKAIFQPTFNYSLFLNRDMNAPFYVKPYGLGLNLGVTYSF